MEHIRHEQKQTGHQRTDELGRVDQRPRNESGSTQGDEGYLGHYASIEAFAQAFVDENALKDRLEPSWLRHYIRFDLTHLARDLVFGLIVVKDAKDGVHVFDPTA